MTAPAPGRDAGAAASSWIERLGLLRHPEGGWYRETYRSPGVIPAGALPGFPGARPFCTAIHFLLEGGDFSALHRLKSDELWHFHAGSPLAVHAIDPAGTWSSFTLGLDADGGEVLQGVVPAGSWFGAESGGAYSLVSCTVAPGFDFQDFEMAAAEDLVRRYPRHRHLIERLTRS